eukprot:2376109-Rhodomonas_salina.3
MLARFASKTLHAVSARFASTTAAAQPHRIMDLYQVLDLSMGVPVESKPTHTKKFSMAPADANLLAADLSFPADDHNDFFMGMQVLPAKHNSEALCTAAESFLSKAASNWELESSNMKYEEMVASQPVSYNQHNAANATTNWELEFSTIRYEDMVVKQPVNAKERQDYMAALMLARGQMWTNA